MNTPNDIVCTINDLNKDITISPKIEEKQKKDIKYQVFKNIKDIEFTYYIACSQCGHLQPISTYQTKKVVNWEMRRRAKLQNSRMGRTERHKRAVRNGLLRALKAGQTLKPKTLQKCTGRKIYKKVAQELQI